MLHNAFILLREGNKGNTKDETFLDTVQCDDLEVQDEQKTPRTPTKMLFSFDGDQGFFEITSIVLTDINI